MWEVEDCCSCSGGLGSLVSYMSALVVSNGSVFAARVSAYVQSILLAARSAELRLWLVGAWVGVLLARALHCWSGGCVTSVC
jgi:hypothetical protein